MSILGRFFCWLGFHYIATTPERKAKDGYLTLYYCKHCKHGFELD